MIDIIFYILAFSTCIFALLTVTARHIFHSAVWLSMCLVSVAAIYFYLDAEFLGVIQVLVYIGGIITLFIFAIKLTAGLNDYNIPQGNKQIIPSALTAGVLFILLLYIIMSSPWAVSQSSHVLTLKDLGTSLMTTYILPFEFISLILLAVMVGAIVIGKVRK